MARHLLSQRFQFLKHRFETPFAEIDLVFRGQDGRTDWLIEVKTLPREFDLLLRVSGAQRRRLRNALNYWIATYQRPTRVMLAVVSQPLKITLVPDFLS